LSSTPLAIVTVTKENAMKLKLDKIEDTVQLKYRVDVSLKEALDQVYEECNKCKPKLNFTGALTQGLWEVVKALKRELAATTSGLTSEPKVEPKIEPRKRTILASQSALPNGTDAESA
jgi:hypothetical protein